MIIAIDIGNTNIKIGVFENDKLKNSWRMAAEVSRTADEYGILLLNLLESSGITVKDITGGIISSVIPQLNYTIEHMLSFYFNIKPISVNVGIKSGLNIKYDNPRELGSDRLVNCVAGLKKYGAPFILVDFGTATTYNVVNTDGDFIGGCITLGVKATEESLANSTAKLPRVELVKTNKVIGRSTVKNIQSGLYFGVVGQVNSIITQIRKEMGDNTLRVIATGGLSELFMEDCDIAVIDRSLSLEGLNIIYNMNCE
ncbi:MAG: type III pantothenate kinase [Clostridia bacterium]